MKKILFLFKGWIVLFALLMSASSNLFASEAAQNRGLFAFVNGNYVQVSWRMRATDNAQNTKYLLYAGNSAGSETTLVGTYTTKTTVRLDKSTYSGKYFKIVVQNASGTQIDSQSGVSVKSAPYLDIPLTAPYIKDASGNTCITYTPGDCSAYDMDGDGEQEIILKWMPSALVTTVNSTTYIGREYIDCYKLNGTRLWRIDMGQNCNAGNNVAFYCWDFDGDGKGELMIKSAPGTKDATGAYVGAAAKSQTGSNLSGYSDRTKTYYRGSDGLPTSDIDSNGNQTSHEWITVFSYQGKELKSRLYWPYFSIQADWNPGGSKDTRTYGRRGCSQKGGVMKIPCIDGKTRPVAFMQRGSYTYVYGTAISWDGTNLVEEWRNSSIKATNTSISSPNSSNYCSVTERNGKKTYQSISLYGEGAHPSVVADLDGDGYDECVIGAAAIDHDGKVLWSTGLGHGDAVHVGEFNPDNDGLEVWRITEAKTKYDACMIDAKTGKILNGQLLTGGDVQRGVAMDIDANHAGTEYVHNNSAYFYDCNGNQLYKKNFSRNTGYPNYRLYWDSDLLDENYSGTMISKFYIYGDTIATNSRCCTPTSGTKSLYSVYKVLSINGTKDNPCLQCDLFGDWREELVMYTTGSDAGISQDFALRILTTCYDTEYKLPWLRDDNTYNMEIACQNVGYSMPPHLGYNPVTYYNNLKFVKPSTSKYYYIKTDDTHYLNFSSISSGKVSVSTTPYAVQFVASDTEGNYQIMSLDGKYLYTSGNYGFGATTTLGSNTAMSYYIINGSLSAGTIKASAIPSDKRENYYFVASSSAVTRSGTDNTNATKFKIVEAPIFVAESGASYYISDVVDNATKYVNATTVTGGYLQNSDTPFAFQFVATDSVGVYKIKVSDTQYLKSGSSFGVSKSAAGTDFHFEMNASGKVAIRSGSRYLIPRSGQTYRLWWQATSTPTYFTITKVSSSSAKFCIFQDETTAISTVTESESIEPVAIYNSKGERLSSVVKGLNIIRYSDGTTRKVLVK